MWEGTLVHSKGGTMRFMTLLKSYEYPGAWSSLGCYTCDSSNQNLPVGPKENWQNISQSSRYKLSVLEIPHSSEEDPRISFCSNSPPPHIQSQIFPLLPGQHAFKKCKPTLVLMKPYRHKEYRAQREWRTLMPNRPRVEFCYLWLNVWLRWGVSSLYHSPSCL